MEGPVGGKVHEHRMERFSGTGARISELRCLASKEVKMEYTGREEGRIQFIFCAVESKKEE